MADSSPSLPAPARSGVPSWRATAAIVCKSAFAIAMAAAKASFEGIACVGGCSIADGTIWPTMDDADDIALVPKIGVPGVEVVVLPELAAYGDRGGGGGGATSDERVRYINVDPPLGNDAD